jgi:putative intracellular protease/amidase
MTQQTVHLFVFDTLSDWEPMHAIAAINSPAWQRQPQRYSVKTVGLSREPIRTIGGVTILPDMTLAELEPEQSAMLILPGSDVWGKGKNAEAVEKARQFLDAGVPVAAICGATAGLALGGILDERRHTGNVLEELLATNYKGAHLYQNQLAYTDGDLITANGVAPLEFAREIIKKLNVYTPPVLDAWYHLHKTGEPAYFFALVEAAQKL